LVPNPSDVKIGAFAGGTGGMVTLKSLGIPAPLLDFLEFSQTDAAGDATIQGNGWSESEWHWGYLTKNQYDALANFKIDKSTPVYTRDRKTGNTYANFLANMIWPERERWESNCVVDFTIRFIAMVEQV
jgi:hypothetical protein